MNTRRVAKAAEAIRESVSMTILVGLRDPRVKNVTVLRAEVSGDLRAAKIFVSVMGDAKAQSLTMHGLESARGFIQSKVADRLQTKNTPVLKFVLDPGVKFSAETSQTLREVMFEDRGGSASVESAGCDFTSDTAETDDNEISDNDVSDNEVDSDEVDDESVSGRADSR